MSAWQANETCIETKFNVMTVTMCRQCCYNRLLPYAGVQRFACYCSDRIVAEHSDFPETNAENPCVEKCPGNLEQICGGGGGSEISGSYLSVYKVLRLGSVPGFVLPFRPNLAGLNNGPYCFFRDFRNSLTASYCNVPYCPISIDHDCMRSNEASLADSEQLVKYTGYKNVSESSEACMDWRSFRVLVLSGDLQYTWDVSYAPTRIARVVSLDVETTDYSVRDRSTLPYNHCRAVRLIADLIVYELDSGVYSYIRKVREFSSAACAYAKSGVAHIGQCSIQFCYNVFGSQYSVVVSRVGEELLLSRFGSNLGIGLTGCSLSPNTGRMDNCRMDNFTTLFHPSLGICHRFNKETDRLVAAGSGSPADTEAVFSYFTDATDSRGRQFASSKLLTSALSHWKLEADTRMAMRVIIVPPGQFPRTEDIVVVNPGQHMKLMIRYDRTTRHSKPPEKECLASAAPIEYLVPNWKSSLRFYNKSEEENVNYTAFQSASDWMEKTDLLRDLLKRQTNGRSEISPTMRFSAATAEDCVDEFVARRIVENCSCIPLFLPVRVGAFPAELNHCFNVTSLDNIDGMAKCYHNQLLQRASLDKSARETCVPLCETRSYSVKMVTYQWPELTTLNAYDFFQSHLLDWNYPNNFLGSRGIASLFALHYLSRLVSQQDRSVDGSINKGTDIKELAENLSLTEKNFVRITVQASSLYGQEIKEEPSYTSKNLLADLGGALGLWSGVSVLTACELIELLVYLIIALRHKLGRRPATDSVGPHQSGGQDNFVSTSDAA